MPAVAGSIKDCVSYFSHGICRLKLKSVEVTDIHGHLEVQTVCLSPSSPIQQKSVPIAA